MNKFMNNQKRSIGLFRGIGALSLINTKLLSVKSCLPGGRVLAVLSIVEQLYEFYCKFYVLAITKTYVYPKQ